MEQNYNEKLKELLEKHKTIIQDLKKIAPKDVRIVNHYPSRKNPNNGTFHIIWESACEEWKGVKYYLRKDKDPYIRIPCGEGFLDPETRKIPCFFPVFGYLDQSILTEIIRATAKLFIEYAKDKGLIFVDIPKLEKKPKYVSEKRFPPPKPSKFIPIAGTFSTNGNVASKPKFRPSAFRDLPNTKYGR
jgi:hypothetical protein